MNINSRLSFACISQSAKKFKGVFVLRNIFFAALSVLFGSLALAQGISADEMILLEKLRAEMMAKGVNVTPDMENRMLQRIRATGAVGQGVQPPRGPAATSAPALLVAPVQPPPPVQPASVAQQNMISESDLKMRLAVLEPARPIGDIQILTDGLMVDGRRFADAEGRATKFATDATKGRIGYLVSGSTPDQSTFKIASADRPGDAVTIGQVRRQANGYQFTSVTGKSLSGELFFPLTDGVLLMRDSVGFRYVAGDGVQQVSIPVGWYPTSMQRGNVSTTGWLLLEKDTSEEKSNPLNVVGKWGKMLGAIDANEYALMQMSTGKLVEINISSSGKNAYSYSQCRRKSAAVSICDKLTSTESAFKPDGTPNTTHYLWNIDWYRTPEGVILLAVEGRLGGVLAGVDLESGKKVALFERTLGVTLQGARVTPEGRLALAVRLGLTSDKMDDVAGEIRSRPGISAAAAQ